MDINKKWEEYTPEQKTTILNHWFYYYGGLIVTLDEIGYFRKLSESRQDDIFDYIVNNFIYNRTVQTNLLVYKMRRDELEDLFSHMLRFEATEGELREQMQDVRNYLISKIVESYIFPEPPVPMDVEIIIEDNNGKGKK